MLAIVVVLVKRNKLSLELFSLVPVSSFDMEASAVPCSRYCVARKPQSSISCWSSGLPVLICLPISFQLPEPTYACCVMSSNFSLRGRTGRNGVTLSESR